MSITRRRRLPVVLFCTVTSPRLLLSLQAPRPAAFRARCRSVMVDTGAQHTQSPVWDQSFECPECDRHCAARCRRPPRQTKGWLRQSEAAMAAVEIANGRMLIAADFARRDQLCIPAQVVMSTNTARRCMWLLTAESRSVRCYGKLTQRADRACVCGQSLCLGMNGFLIRSCFPESPARHARHRAIHH